MKKVLERGNGLRKMMGRGEGKKMKETQKVADVRGEKGM